jgi:leader peptidase (prepilin peptidase)/N-methyltransferase
MTLFYTGLLFSFIIGTLMGSFLHLVALRWPRERSWRSVVYPPSHCDSCKKRLKWFELISIFSFIMLRGKCRYCHSAIPATSFYAEMLTGILYALAFILFGWQLELLVAIILFSFLSLLTWTDIYYRLIPNPMVLFGGIIALFLRYWTGELPFLDYIIGGIVGFIVLFIIALISKGGMGGGDVKLFAMIGFFIGWKGVLLSLVMASAVGSLYGIYLIIRSKYERRMKIPFAPSILLGTVLVYGWVEDWFYLYIHWIGRVVIF